MLLKALHDFAQTRDLLKDLAFAQRPVRWIIELDETGGFLGVSQAGDDKRGKEFPCPQTTRAKTGAGVAEFLADGFTAVFGLESNPDAPRKAAEWKARLANNLTKRANFWRQIRRAAKECGSSNRLALLRCWKLTRSSKEPPPFLRWGTSTAPKAKEQNSWWMTLAGGGEVKLGAESFTIRIGNELLLDRPEFQDWWRKTHSRELAVLGEKNPRGICLVTSAENVVLALTHRPPIYGVPDTGSFGAPIVSFDKPAFQSYGLEQSLNAPTSDEAARAYATGLNWMLRNPDHHLRVGPATVVFWAKRTDSAARTIANFLKQPRPETVRKFLISPWSGMDDRMAKKDDFYAVTLGGNAGRIVVKRWVQEPLESAIDHISQWFRDLHLEVRPRLEPKPKKTGSKPPTEYHPLSIYWLACTTIRPDSICVPN
jgi:CRISPR-associated protein Csd1